VRLRIELASPAVRPGEPVSGHVLVLDGGAARAVRARLEFVEQVGRMSRAARVESERVIDSGPLERGDVVPFALRLADDAAPGVRTDVGHLRWDLVVTVDRPLRPDLEERVELEVVRP
jgi:hypothetical protein